MTSSAFVTNHKIKILLFNKQLQRQQKIIAKKKGGTVGAWGGQNLFIWDKKKINRKTNLPV